MQLLLHTTEWFLIGCAIVGYAVILTCAAVQVTRKVIRR